jgi:hypothetical protein
MKKRWVLTFQGIRKVSSRTPRLFTRAAAESNCRKKGAKLPSASEFEIFSKDLGYPDSFQIHGNWPRFLDVRDRGFWTSEPVSGRRSERKGWAFNAMLDAFEQADVLEQKAVLCVL